MEAFRGGRIVRGRGDGQSARDERGQRGRRALLEVATTGAAPAAAIRSLAGRSKRIGAGVSARADEVCARTRA
jgi:hypothetical protein